LSTPPPRPRPKGYIDATSGDSVNGIHEPKILWKEIGVYISLSGPSNVKRFDFNSAGFLADKFDCCMWSFMVAGLLAQCAGMQEFYLFPLCVSNRKKERKIILVTRSEKCVSEAFDCIAQSSSAIKVSSLVT